MRLLKGQKWRDKAEVYLWGTRIGIIYQDITKAYASFEYDKDFLKSGIGSTVIV
ncbi:MAG: HipA N-terminal domain-containing protein [Lachnospiraceae bacterium]|nr:HipA N-terminal domain-containing protein [Lachnospiraceae bacterium]